QGALVVMPIAFTAGSEAPAGTEVLGVPVFAGPTLAGGTGVEIDRGFLARQGFEGKLGETVPLLADDGGTVVAVGVGPVADVDLDTVRRAAAAFTKAAWHAGAGAFVLPAELARLGAGATQAVIEGVGLSAYHVGLYKSAPAPCQLGSLTVVGGDEAGVRRGAAVVEAVTFARDLVNEPAGAMSPSRLADAARAMGDKAGFEVTVLDEKAIERESLGGLLGVSRGSAEPPRLIRMEWSPPNP